MKNRWMLLGLLMAVFSHAQTQVDGTLIKKGGLEYKITPLSKVRKIRVDVLGDKAKLPNEMVVQLKKEGKILDRVKVKLDEQSPEKSHYTGIIPANIMISGGITFEIE